MNDIDTLGAQVVGNLIAAPLFVAGFGLIPEPWRQRICATIMVFAATVYLGHGLGPWEPLFAVVIAACGLLGFRHYPAIGIGWLVHTLSDVFHHSAGMPMVEWIPLSSFGCAIFDPLIAIWFFYGAPSTRSVLRAVWRPSARLTAPA